METIETEDSRFTEQQKDLLRNTWKGVWNKDVKLKFSVSLFKNLFTAHPELQQLFRGMKEIEELETLIKSPKLKAHALRVVSSVNNLIENLDSPEVFVEMLKNLARSHKGNNVSKLNFEQLGPILIMTMREFLGDELSPKATDAWVAAYTFIVESVWGEYQLMVQESEELSLNGNSEPEN
ncbi:globin-1-like [Amphiura filiformis]|uniref:globin-1-like n=1 Tax=Amphiura filiformis TaxID=82378 RepID=UPI003B20D575